MKINRLTASFGKFNNETIAFHGGLNVVYAPNESGKSTWCAFIRAMLYGVDSSERARAGYIPEKQRYAPWSGAPMEGAMELTADRCDITVTRSTRNKNAPMQEFSAVYTGSSEPVKKLTGTNCGEQLTGVTRDVFCRSAFVAQGASAVTGSPELEKRICALLSSGEEDTSFTEAEERLLAWQRKRKCSHRGLLPEIEQKIDDVSVSLETVEKSAEKLSELEDELTEVRKDCADLENEVTDARKLHRRAVKTGLNEARTEARQLAEAQNAAQEEVNSCRDSLRSSVFGTKNAEEVEQQAETDMAELRSLQNRNGRNRFLLPAILAFLFSLCGGVVYDKFLPNPVIIIAAGIFLAASLVFLYFFSKRRRADHAAQQRIGQILKTYAADSIEEITNRLDEHHALCLALKKAADRERSAAEAADKAYEKLAALEEKATEELDFIAGNSKAAELGKQLTEKRRYASQLNMTVISEQNRISMLGDPVVLQGDLNHLKGERDALRAEYEAIETALAVLRESDDEIRSRVSPQLGAVASRYMSYVTGGKYEDVLLAKDLSAMARAKDEIVPRDSVWLSAGTADLLYLVVRLAICELALPDGEPCPLIIDDALVNLDRERYGQAMELLKEIARERQVILFTCRQPE